VAGCCDCVDEPSGSCATELVNALFVRIALGGSGLQIAASKATHIFLYLYNLRSTLSIS
jgi:hypothetical protein